MSLIMWQSESEKKVFSSIIIIANMALALKLAYWLQYYILLCRMEFLAEYTTTTMSEIKLNAETFRWLDRIPAILEEHSNIISRSRREAEEGLKVCIFLRWKLTSD